LRKRMGGPSHIVHLCEAITHRGTVKVGIPIRIYSNPDIPDNEENLGFG
jgi:hypothetical protein